MTFVGNFLWGIVKIAGSLGIFLFGMRVMSDSIQKTAGEKLQSLLNAMTYNRITGVITGMVITGIIQSSSATTVILVSLVNAGLMNLTKAISVIMGANIGTTLTAWIVSLIGFKFDINIFIMPAIAVGFPLIFNKHEKVRNTGEILIGFGLLFLGICFLKEAVPQPNLENASLKNIITTLAGYRFYSVILFVIIGSLITMIIQSSSAAMAITITMGFKGWINFETAAALCLGENIGTTITAFIASLGMKPPARRAARAHMLFNVFGVLWILMVFYPFVKMIYLIIPGDILNPKTFPVHLSLFHTMFNVANTFILIWFIPLFARIVEFLIPYKEEDQIKEYKLDFIETSYPDFAETNLALAKREIGNISVIVYDMLIMFLNAIKQDKKEITLVEEKIEKTDKKVDVMYEEISRFLAECRKNIIIEKQSFSINSMLIIVSELKSISNSCENLIQLLKKKEKKKLKFHKNAKKEIEEYTEEVLDFLKYNSDYIKQSLKIHNIDLAEKMEKVINSKRDRLRKISQNKMMEGASIQGELIYMDIIKHLEHIGDFSMNIAHSLQDI
jgi:phosphate:Na+ symporter